MNPFETQAQQLTRRACLGRTAAGLGSLALSSLPSPHLFGVDHNRLADRYQGRPFRLTDVPGNVMTDILAQAARARRAAGNPTP